MASSACASIGSPSVVPVPCASTASIVGGGQAGVGERLPDDALLRGAVGGGQAVARAVLVDRRAADHRQDRVAVALRVGQPLQQDQAGALAPAGAVGASANGLQRPSGGQPALPGELDEGARGGHDGDAAGQGQVHSPLRSAWAARCRATSDEEHAVSTVTAGPSRPKV